MIRLIWRLAILIALAALFTWLADRPGTVTVHWLGREIETPLMAAIAAILIAVAALLLTWGLLRRLFHSPAAVGGYFRYRRTRKSYESLSKGIIAAGAGDVAAATRHALLAAKGLTDEPLLRLLEAQAAQLKGDRAAVKQAFEAMLTSPQTEALGLRGLFSEARQAGDAAKARELAERALQLNPALAWASSAMLAIQSAAKDWTGAAATLETQRRAGRLDPETANRQRAALLTAQALSIEEADPASALDLALKGHKLDPALVPAASVAARGYIRQGSPRKAFKILSKTWSLSPHPDLAELQAHAKPGAQPAERLARVRDLLAVYGGGEEGRVALAKAAVAAREWSAARKALEPLIAGRPQARVCALMADIEEGENGDKGRAREWLARAVRAPRDPMWVSGGVAVPVWTPVSPATGELAPCEWKAPFDVIAEAPAERASVPAPPPAEPKPTLAPPELERARPVMPVRPPDDPGPASDLDDLDPDSRRRLVAGG